MKENEVGDNVCPYCATRTPNGGLGMCTRCRGTKSGMAMVDRSVEERRKKRGKTKDAYTPENIGETLDAMSKDDILKISQPELEKLRKQIFGGGDWYTTLQQENRRRTWADVSANRAVPPEKDEPEDPNHIATVRLEPR